MVSVWVADCGAPEGYNRGIGSRSRVGLMTVSGSWKSGSQEVVVVLGVDLFEASTTWAGMPRGSWVWVSTLPFSSVIEETKPSDDP